MWDGQKLCFRSPAGRVWERESLSQHGARAAQNQGQPSHCAAAADRIGWRHGGLLHQPHPLRPCRGTGSLPPPLRIGGGDGCGHAGPLERGRGARGRGLAPRRLRSRFAGEHDGGTARSTAHCKHLITGNNDLLAATGLVRWSSVRPYVEIESNGFGLMLCHYAFRSWRNMSQDLLNLHGHSHGRLAPLLRQTTVGVDPWDFRPVMLAQITAAKRPRASAMRSS